MPHRLVHTSLHMVSVIVVSYNTRELLRECLQSIESHHEIIVIDNASGDGSADMVDSEFPSARLIRNTINRGFGAANNQGISVATGDLVLLLNSDAEAKPGAIDLLSTKVQGDVVAAGGKLLHPDGRLQESAASNLTLAVVLCEQLYLEKIARIYWRSSALLTGGDVEQVMGACLMMKPVEQFDERYFLYCEDTDLCHRLRRHGRIIYAPEAEFLHHLGASSSQDRWRSIIRYNHGKELYFLIHHGKFSWLGCLFLDRLGALLRCFVKPRMFWRVLFAQVRPENPGQKSI